MSVSLRWIVVSLPRSYPRRSLDVRVSVPSQVDSTEAQKGADALDHGEPDAPIKMRGSAPRARAPAPHD